MESSPLAPCPRLRLAFSRQSRVSHDGADTKWYNNIRHMMRRTLALYVVLCLLVGTLAVPASSLVCCVTGRAMVAVVETSKSCCATAPVLSTDGAVRFALNHPGCCNLRPGPEHPPAPAAVTVPVPLALAWVPAAPSIFLPPSTEMLPSAGVVQESVSRAPPGRPASLRAPPSFS